jgi:hypothetical protein
MGTRIYLAGGWNDHAIISDYARRLESVGFELTYDWMKEAAKPNVQHDAAIPCATRRTIAHDEIHAVVMAQVFWLLVPSYNGSKGSWVELGAAIAASRYGDVTLVRRIIVSGQWKGTLFTDHESVGGLYDTHELAFQRITNNWAT